MPLESILLTSSLQCRQHSFSTGEVTIHSATAARVQRRSIIETTLEIWSLRIAISRDVDTVLFLFWTLMTDRNEFLLVRH
jgi:hypothetical protein